MIDIYTDGSCLGNPGPGGYGIIMVYAGQEFEFSGGEAHTTNNRMELMGVIQALKILNDVDPKVTTDCRITTDSAYVVNAFNQRWIPGWIRRGWKNSKGDPVANKELWLQLIQLIGNRKVEFVHIKGHAGHKYNERCDTLARDQSYKFGR